MGRTGRTAVGAFVATAALSVLTSPAATAAPADWERASAPAAAPAAAPARVAQPKAAPVAGTAVARPAGSIDYTYAGRSHTVRGAILDRYLALGGERGALGWPVSSEVLLPGGAFTHFQNGSIYWSHAGGAQVVKGAIRDRWAATGWELGPLGYPVSEEIAVRGGVVQRFRGGLVYFSPATGAQEVRGAILDRYLAAAAEVGELGFPITGEIGIAGGAFTHFQHGSIYFSPATGAHVVKGFFRDLWAKNGWELSRFRFPATDEYPIAGGVMQDYQGGQMKFVFAEPGFVYYRYN